MAEDKQDETLLALHRRLLEGDPLASEQVARLLLSPLVEETHRDYRGLDQQLVADAVVDALLDYFEAPDGVDDGSRIHAFLRKAAWRNAANLSRGGKRRKLREERWVAEHEATVVEDPPALGTLIEDEEKVEAEKRVAELMALLPNERDRGVLRLRLAGERAVEVFAQVLGIDDLPVREQRKMVKQAKDRIDKIIKRRRERPK